jgi:hypothetical protein
MGWLFVVYTNGSPHPQTINLNHVTAHPLLARDLQVCRLRPLP